MKPMQQREEKGRQGVGWEVPVSTEGEAARLTSAIQGFWGSRRLMCRKNNKGGLPTFLTAMEPEEDAIYTRITILGTASVV